MEPNIATLSIERFRAIQKLSIEGLGRVNLITGRNNTGKSSVLEALRILISEASPLVINSILRSREEDVGESAESSRSIAIEGVLPISSLFHGFPRLTDMPQSIVIKANGSGTPKKLVLDVGWGTEQRESDGSMRLVPGPSNLFAEGNRMPVLNLETVSGKRTLSFEYYRPFVYRARYFRPVLGDETGLPCVFVSPYGEERTASLGALWDNIALSDREKDVVAALRIIDPEITAVSMVGGQGPQQPRTAIVRSNNFDRPVPLRSYGDGLNRLFGIVLSLVNAKDGFLLIDEFENGMHHTVQLDAWRVIFKLSQRLGIQVFATSHSWDAIEAFQKAAIETPEEGLLIRLSRKGDEIVPTLFREDELAIATREHIEVR